MTKQDIYCHAIRHDFRDKWCMLLCDNTSEVGWTEDLWLADVFLDIDDVQVQPLPPHSHWHALSWGQYAFLMGIEP